MSSSSIVRHYTIRRDDRPQEPAADGRALLLDELRRHYAEFFGHPPPPSTEVRWEQSTIEDVRRYAKNWAALMADVRAKRVTSAAAPKPRLTLARREPPSRSDIPSAELKQGRLFDTTAPPFLDGVLTGEAAVKGLSLTRPWPFAFITGPAAEQKRVENRSWPPPPKMVGHFLALHAAQSWSEDDRDTIARLTGLRVPANSDSASGEIFAVCRLVGCVEFDDDVRLSAPQRKWFFGPYGWLIAELVPLVTPVRCSGGQKS